MVDGHQRVDTAQLAAHVLHLVLAARAVLVPQTGVLRLLLIGGTVTLRRTEVHQLVPVVGVVHQVEPDGLLQLLRVRLIHLLDRRVAALLQERLESIVVRSHHREDTLAVDDVAVARQLDGLEEQRVAALFLEHLIGIALQPARHFVVVAFVHALLTGHDKGGRHNQAART